MKPFQKEPVIKYIYLLMMAIKFFFLHEATFKCFLSVGPSSVRYNIWLGKCLSEHLCM